MTQNDLDVLANLFLQLLQLILTAYDVTPEHYFYLVHGVFKGWAYEVKNQGKPVYEAIPNYYTQENYNHMCEQEKCSPM